MKIHTLFLMVFLTSLVLAEPNTPAKDPTIEIAELKATIKKHKKTIRLARRKIAELKKENKQLRILCKRAGIRMPRFLMEKSEKSFEFSIGSPEYISIKYMNAWQNQNWKQMATFTQKTWCSNKTNPEAELEAYFGFKELKSFQIINVKKITNVCVDITFIIEYEVLANENIKSQIKARVIKEIAPYMPNENGQWGINPSSMLGEQIITMPNQYNKKGTK